MIRSGMHAGLTGRREGAASMNEHARSSRRRAARSAARVAALPAATAFLDSFVMAAALTLRITAWLLLAAALGSALYLVKSAVGIDLLPGPSPLHDLLYPLLRR